MQQQNNNEYEEVEASEIINLGNLNTTQKIEIKAVERKTGERFVLAFLTLALFIAGLIISLINVLNANDIQRQQLQAHAHPSYANVHNYKDAGRRYDFESKSFVYENR